MNIILFGLNINWVAQLVGLFATALMVIALSKSKEKYLFLMMFTPILFATESGLLGGFSNIAVNASCAIRSSTMYYYYKKNEAYPKWMTVINIILLTVPAILLCKVWYDFMPIVTGIVYSFITLSKNFLLIQIFSAILESLIIVYLVYIGAYVGIVRQVLAVTLIIHTIIKTKKAYTPVSQHY